VLFLVLLLPIKAYSNVTQKRTLDEFTELDVSNSVTVVLQKANKDEKSEATIDAQGIDLQDIYTVIKGSKLYIGLNKKFTVYDLNILSQSKDVKIYLKYKNLNQHS